MARPSAAQLCLSMHAAMQRAGLRQKRVQSTCRAFMRTRALLLHYTADAKPRCILFVQSVTSLSSKVPSIAPCANLPSIRLSSIPGRSDLFAGTRATIARLHRIQGHRGETPATLPTIKWGSLDKAAHIVAKCTQILCELVTSLDVQVGMLAAWHAGH